MPSPNAYVVTLTEKERVSLLDLLKQGEVNARILLLSAAGATDHSRADVITVNPQTVRTIRKRFVAEGPEAALQERPPAWNSDETGRQPGGVPDRPGLQRAAGGPGVLDDAALGRPAGGTEDGGIHLRRNGAAGVKTTTFSPGRSSSGVLDRFLRASSGVWTMCRTGTPNLPTHDDRSYRLVADVQVPLPMEPGRPQRVDDAYERHGCCIPWLIVHPLTGWREVHVTERRTVARHMQWPVDGVFPEAEGMRVVRDNRNPHPPGRSVPDCSIRGSPTADTDVGVSRYDPPKHGSWPNMMASTPSWPAKVWIGVCRI